MTSMRRNDVASTSFRRHVPNRFLINQCQKITFLILKYDIIENSRIKLRGIVLPVQVDALLGGPKGMLALPPPSQIIGGACPPPPPPAPPPSSYAYGYTPPPCLVFAAIYKINERICAAFCLLLCTISLFRIGDTLKGKKFFGQENELFKPYWEWMSN